MIKLMEYNLSSKDAGNVEVVEAIDTIVTAHINYESDNRKLKSLIAEVAGNASDPSGVRKVLKGVEQELSYNLLSNMLNSILESWIEAGMVDKEVLSHTYISEGVKLATLFQNLTDKNLPYLELVARRILSGSRKFRI